MPLPAAPADAACAASARCGRVGASRAVAARPRLGPRRAVAARPAERGRPPGAYSTGAGVTVAVIDSGVDANHPDLAGQVLPGIDLVEPGAATDDTDPVGHGTTVAGLIAGRNDDDDGVVGLAPNAKILPVRVLDEDNRYDDAHDRGEGRPLGRRHGAQVINLSLGGAGSSPALAAALDYAFAQDVVVVACTGNVAPASPTDVWYPAREPGVIAVAGLERQGDALWSGSITGTATVLTAPATDLVGARPGGFWRVQGTSFAAPLVSATAALVRSRWPDMPAGEVVNRLITTARDLGAPGRDARYGFGVVDPVAALTARTAGRRRQPARRPPVPGEAGFGPAPAAPRRPSPAAAARDRPSPGRAPARRPGRPASRAATPTAT